MGKYYILFMKILIKILTSTLINKFLCPYCKLPTVKLSPFGRTFTLALYTLGLHTP
jgi:hypothetical protein